MENYSLRTNPKPFTHQTALPHKVLYAMDRKYVLEKEHYDISDMRGYDRRVKQEQIRTLTQKGYLIHKVSTILKDNKQIKFGFNKYNGYYINIGHIQYETFNYLKFDILEDLFTKIL